MTSNEQTTNQPNCLRLHLQHDKVMWPHDCAFRSDPKIVKCDVCGSKRAPLSGVCWWCRQVLRAVYGRKSA